MCIHMVFTQIPFPNLTSKQDDAKAALNEQGTTSEFPKAPFRLF